MKRSLRIVSASLIIALLFLIFSSPIVYSVTDVFGRYVGYPYVDAKGCPTNVGRFIHAFVMFLVVLALMYLAENVFFPTNSK
jgi:hypothetical protein